MLSQFMNDEMGTFKEVMAEYGQLRDPFQMSYKLEGDGFRVFVKCNKIKRFDERADVAATRLLEFCRDGYRNQTGERMIRCISWR